MQQSIRNASFLIISLILLIYSSAYGYECSSVPNIISPDNWSTTNDQAPYFTWDNGISPDTSSFLLSVCKSPDAETNCFKMSGSTKSGTSTKKFIDDLSPDTQYYWQVKYTCGDYWGNSSEIFTFHTPPSLFDFSKSLNLNNGWNLVGATTTIPASIFLSQNNIISVWTWKNSAWSVLFPNDNDGGKAYADSKGFSILSTISPGEGYWVNISGL